MNRRKIAADRKLPLLKLRTTQTGLAWVSLWRIHNTTSRQLKHWPFHPHNRRRLIMVVHSPSRPKLHRRPLRWQIWQFRFHLCHWTSLSPSHSHIPCGPSSSSIDAPTVHLCSLHQLRRIRKVSYPVSKIWIWKGVIFRSPSRFFMEMCLLRLPLRPHRIRILVQLNHFFHSLRPFSRAFAHSIYRIMRSRAPLSHRNHYLRLFFHRLRVMTERGEVYGTYGWGVIRWRTSMDLQLSLKCSRETDLIQNGSWRNWIWGIMRLDGYRLKWVCCLWTCCWLTEIRKGFFLLFKCPSFSDV